MKTIKNNISDELIIKNSKFITNIFKINNYDDIFVILNKINDEYNDATHNCYAYIFEGMKKCSDDNEPSGTAGIPILQVLEKKELSNILVIVTRYFGGIKLGASGLVRAYTNSVTNALNKTEIIELIKGKNIDIIFNYDVIKKIDYILRDITILDKEFNDSIKYNLNVNDNILNELNTIKDIKIIINKDIYL